MKSEIPFHLIKFQSPHIYLFKPFLLNILIPRKYLIPLEEILNIDMS